MGPGTLFRSTASQGSDLEVNSMDGRALLSMHIGLIVGSILVVLKFLNLIPTPSALQEKMTTIHVMVT